MTLVEKLPATHPTYARLIHSAKALVRLRFRHSVSGTLSPRHRTSVAIQKGVSIRFSSRGCFAEVLCYRTNSREGMFDHVEVHDLAVAILDHEQAVEPSECQRRHGEEFERGNRF